MTLLYILPGFGGSELVYDNSWREKLWVDKKRLAKGEVRNMKLDITGELPEAGASRLVPSAPLSEEYDEPLKMLDRQIKDQNITVIATPYDWRQSITLAAAKLQTDIMSRNGGPGSVVLAGHSQGGLVARYCYFLMNIAGQANIIKRIICMGTPHFGTFATWELWAGQDSTVSDLVHFNQTLLGSAPFLTQLELIRLTATWRGLYELMPSVLGPEAVADDRRAEPYNIDDFWGPDLQLNPLHFGNAKALQTTFLDPRSKPPGLGMVNILGHGFKTNYAVGPAKVAVQTIAGPLIVDNRKRWYSTSDGDGTTTVRSGSLLNALNVTVRCSHRALFKLAVSSGVLLSLTEEDFSGAPSNPVPVRELPVSAPYLAVDPPLFAKGQNGTAIRQFAQTLPAPKTNAAAVENAAKVFGAKRHRDRLRK